MLAVETTDLTKYYGKARGIIRVDLAVQEGEIFGFIGPNGAGKSTTIRTLLNFLQPTSGHAKIFGLDCVRKTEKIKRSIGYVPADVHYYDDMRVQSLLRYSAKYYRGNHESKMLELCATLELDLTRRIDELSSGNRKKVAIVQALLHNPRLIILDEATSGLDPLMQQRFFTILSKERQEGKTIFFSSHNLSEVQKLCDRVAIIREGRIIQTEHIETLRSNKYKKIRVEFHDDDMAEKFSLEGMSNVTISGRTKEFIYRGKVGPVLRQLAGVAVENIWMEDPTLEEIFMHYYAGRVE